ncbi:hypothetical protein M9458_053078, partial [Cirrhinus mrigala]
MVSFGGVEDDLLDDNMSLAASNAEDFYEWFLLGRRQTSRQCASVDDTKEKGYGKMPLLDESVAAHLCPPTTIEWKAKFALHGCAP